MQDDERKRAEAALALAVARAGSQKELAERLDISSPAVAGWDVVPVKRVQAVSEATGVPKADLRPDHHDITEMDPDLATEALCELLAALGGAKTYGDGSNVHYRCTERLDMVHDALAEWLTFGRPDVMREYLDARADDELPVEEPPF